MGFRQGAYARIWSVDDAGKYCTGNISISRKNKETGEYTVEFNHGYVRFVGEANTLVRSLGLPTRDEFVRGKNQGVNIKINSCDVTTYYNAESKKSYTNFTIFSFELPENSSGGSGGGGAKKSVAKPVKKKAAPVVEDEEDSDLPF